jgi:hypothetical protein
MKKMKLQFILILFVILTFVLDSFPQNSQSNFKDFSSKNNEETIEELIPTDLSKSEKKESKNLTSSNKKDVSIPRFSKPPVIDGKIDEEVWNNAGKFDNFVQISPGDNIAPTNQTKVYAGYDQKFLYLAFIASDSSNQVRATIAKRDSIFADDNVGVYLDTYNDKRRAYTLFFNPLGIQADGVFTEGRGSDFTIDIVMESKGQITTDGYTVEVAIPFKSLRYSAGKKKIWGINFYREIKRGENEFNSWVPISRDQSGLLAQFGILNGIEDIGKEKTLDVIPSLVVSETGRRARTYGLPPNISDSGRFLNQPVKVDPGLTVKLGLNSSTTLDFALNPDFAQVEADQRVITVNQRFPIFYSEKRPFFLEGIEIFQTPLNPLNTRAIIDPDFATKLSGKRGKHSFGVLVASDNAPGNFTEDERNDPLTRPFISRFIDKNAFISVFRYKRDIGKENTLGAIATTYKFPDRRNYTSGVDGRFRLNSTSFLSFQGLGTFSKRCSEFTLGNINCSTRNGIGYYFLYDNSGRHWSFNLSGSGRSKNYIADVGFTPRVDTNRKALTVKYNSDFKPNKKLINWNVTNTSVINYNWKGHSQNAVNEIQANLNFPSQTFVGIGGNVGYERLSQEEFGIPFAGSDNERSTYYKNLFGYIGSTPNKKFTFFLFAGYTWDIFDFDFGAGFKFPRVSPRALTNPFGAPLDPGSGNSFNGSLNITFQPTNALQIKFDFTKSYLVRRDTNLTAFDTNIYSLLANYRFTRFLSVRARTDYETLSTSLSGQYLFAWEPNPGTALFVGYNNNFTNNGVNPFTFQRERGINREGQTFFIKLSYLFRKNF